jgi:hypothetical protein
MTYITFCNLGLDLTLPDDGYQWWQHVAISYIHIMLVQALLNK